ncbi:MAG: hypothetical protein GXY60_12320 [Spirochaetales bacterium]|nr:hypothetical protein [Spirochaetales bacterium]
MIGPFFYIDSSELSYKGWLFDCIDESAGEQYGDFRTSPKGHSQVFDTFLEKHPGHKDLEYFEFPRGRVVYNSVAGAHTVYIDRCIRTKIAEVVKAFNIRSYVIGEDDHYVCPGCAAREII